jgi:hypothetical protein
MKSTRRSFSLFALLLASAALPFELHCQPAKREIRLKVSRFADKTDTLIWTAYAIALAAWTSENLDNSNVPEGVFQPSFIAEVAARERQLRIWGELTEKEPKTNAYIEAVVRASKAGFLKEYVWSSHRRPEWGEASPALRLTEFEEWRAVHLQGHEPITGAYLSFGPKVTQ